MHALLFHVLPMLSEQVLTAGLSLGRVLTQPTSRSFTEQVSGVFLEPHFTSYLLKQVELFLIKITLTPLMNS